MLYFCKFKGLYYGKRKRENRGQHLTPDEMETYKKSLENNYYVRDIANFARMEGKMEVASKLLLNGTPIKEVMYLTELSKEQVLEVLDRLPKS